MTTKQKLIDDVVLQLTQGAPTDDFTIEKAQIAQWATIHLNDLVSREIDALLKKGYMIPPIYITREKLTVAIEQPAPDEGDGLIITGNQPTIMVDSEYTDDTQQRMFVTVTSNEILNLPRDRGLVQILIDGVGLVYKTSQENIMMLNDLRFARPARGNRTYYRYGNKIFFDLLGENFAGKTVIVDYIPVQDVYTMADNATINITDNMYPILLDMLVQRGKLELLGSSAADQDNDGITKVGPTYHQQIANPTKSSGGGQQEQTEE